MINIKPIKRSDIFKLTEIEKNVYDYSTYVEDFENYLNKNTI